MKRKSSALLCMLLCAVLLLSSCARKPIVPDESGIATGSLGDIFQGQHMEVTVKSAKKVSSYGGYSPKNRDSLVDFVVYIENISTEDLLLLDNVFQLQWGEKGFADPLVAVEDNTMAPLETILPTGESVEYHYLYSIPEAVTIMRLCFHDIVPAERTTFAGGNAYFYVVDVSL